MSLKTNKIISLVVKPTVPSGHYFDKNVGRFYNNVSEFLNKVDDDNEDQEKDEVTIVWEIERDWSAKYFRRSSKNLNKKIRIFKIIELCNLRKQYGFEGELLVRWNNGQRDWSPVSQVYVDNNNAYQVMVNEFIPKMRQTMITVEFGLYNKQRDEKEEKRLHEEREKQEIKEQQEMTDARKIQPTKNKLPMKRNLDTEYGTAITKQKQEKPKQQGTRISKRILKNSSPGQNNVNKPNPSRATASNKRLKNIISPNPKPNNEPNPNQVSTGKHTIEPNLDPITERIPKKSKLNDPYEVYKQKQIDIEKAIKANLLNNNISNISEPNSSTTETNISTEPNTEDDTPNPKLELSTNPNQLSSPADFTTPNPEAIDSTTPDPEVNKPNPNHNSKPNPNQHSASLDHNNSTTPNPEVNYTRAATNRTTSYLSSAT